jgi:hypothetical protein
MWLLQSGNDIVIVTQDLERVI